VALAPTSAFTSLRAGCSLANTTLGSEDRQGCRRSDILSRTRRLLEGKKAQMGWQKVRNFLRL
jgi:hypothetical protein